MTESFYAAPSAAIALALLASMALCVELGHRLGRAVADRHTEASRAHLNGVQAAILGLLALLLAFSSSLALQRFDNRSEAVVDEANAIGTAFLRTDLLPPPQRDEARLAISKYLDARVQEAALPLPESAARSSVDALAARAQAEIWALGVRVAQSNVNSLTPHLFVQSVNDMIDSYGKRNASVSRHVPGLVLALLFVTLLLSAAILGFTAGAGGHAPSLVTFVLLGLMVVAVFIVLDLDRPRQGIIQVNHASLLDLKSTVDAALRARR